MPAVYRQSEDDADPICTQANPQEFFDTGNSLSRNDDGHSLLGHS